MRLGFIAVGLLAVACAEAGSDAMFEPDGSGLEDDASADGDSEVEDASPPDSGAPPPALINEVLLDIVGIDSHEFLELRGAASTSYAAYTFVVIEGDGTEAGVIDGVFPVGTTDADGRWSTGFQPSNTLENGTCTVLLVEGFTGAAAVDLDPGNDGTLDTTPWLRIVDAVAVKDGSGTDYTYALPVLAGNFDGLNPAHPGGASRLPEGTDTDQPSDWKRNDFDGQGLPGLTGTPIAGEALNTPATANTAAQ